jgi:hypothetical protein
LKAFFTDTKPSQPSFDREAGAQVDDLVLLDPRVLIESAAVGEVGRAEAGVDAGVELAPQAAKVGVAVFDADGARPFRHARQFDARQVARGRRGADPFQRARPFLKSVVAAVGVGEVARKT